MKARSNIILVMSLLMQCLHASTGYAAGLSVEPGFHSSFSVQEAYSDNINLAPINKKADTITTVSPGLKYYRSDTMSSMDIAYNPGFVYYYKDADKNYIRQQASINAWYLSEEHWNIYLKDSFIRSDEQGEQEILSTAQGRAVYWRNIAEPAVEYQYGPENRVGILFRNNTYRTTGANSQNSQEKSINSLLDHWYDKRNGIHLEYGYSIGTFEQSPEMQAYTATIRYTNRFRQRSAIFGEYLLIQRSFEPTSLGYDIQKSSMGVTHAFSPALSTSAQIGYFVKTPTSGSSTRGLSYKATMSDLDIRTLYSLTFQGGYTEDFFTSENLGFTQYHRFTGSLMHLLGKWTSIGLSGSVERVEFDLGRQDRGGGVTGTLSHRYLEWLTASLECSRHARSSNSASYNYTEGRGMLKLTATY